MFQAPTILCPGQRAQWNLTPQFDYHAEAILRIFTCRGVVAMPAHQWIKDMDMSNDGWHAKQNPHNFVQLSMQFLNAAKLRNMSLVAASLQTQPIPFRQPLIDPALTGYEPSDGLQRA